MITEVGEVGALRIRLGVWMVDPGEGTIVSVQAVPCRVPHVLEVYHAFILVGTDYPADMDMQADNGCYPAFEPFVGESYERSMYDYMIITPTPESWAEMDDREVLCALTSYDGQATFGSGEGTAK